MFAPYIYARERTTNRLPAISSRPARAKPRLKNQKNTIRKSGYRALDYSQKWGLPLDAKIYYFAKNMEN